MTVSLNVDQLLLQSCLAAFTRKFSPYKSGSEGLIKVFDLITAQDLPGILSTSAIVTVISTQNEQIRGVFSTLVDPNSIC